ncbi:MAG: glycoside-pentoside-hexuronide (GPH):cation symporter [Phenylobacterium sp.]|nr:glycoside-pentoside-hexuronide (GPH):cation symporter [Phenylobacterium sp.]
MSFLFTPPPGHRLSVARKSAFTSGDFACNLYWQSVSLYLLFFYTDVVGLSAATAGLIYMVASIFDGMTDPVMGAIADRTRTKHGRYRPYVLWGGVPLGLAFILLYYKPPLEGVALVAWILLAHLIFRLAYTALSIPYTSLNARITDSSAERSTLAGFRMIFATLAGLTIAASTQPLATTLGGGDMAWGYTLTAAIYATVATLIFPFVYLTTREPVDAPEAAPPPLQMSEYWSAVRRNRAFWAVMAAICTTVICSTALGKSVLYYFKYYLDDEGAGRIALSLNAASGLLIIPAWIFASKFISKRTTWFVCVVWGLSCLSAFALIDVRSPALMMAFLLLVQVSSLGAAMTFWSMLPDTVEYGEWKTGMRAESFIFGLGQFFLKVALGLGAGIFGLSLDFAGFHPNVQQTPETLAGLKTIMVALPMAGLVLGGIAMLLYPLKRGVHETIVEQLAARRNVPPESVVDTP